MARNDLTAQRLRELLDYDPETGAFTWKADRKCGRNGSNVMRLAGVAAGSRNKVMGYVFIGIDGKTYLAHRLAWLYVHGIWPERQIDHIDGDRANNRIENLRDVSASINAQNQRRAPSGKSTNAPLGAHWKKHCRLWASNIQVDGRLLHLGYFKTADDAHEAYVVAKRRLHAGCTI